MSANVKAVQTSQEFDELKTRLKTTWMTGDYDLFSRFMQKDAEEFFQRLEVKPGTRLLDVGCGAGQLALIAARAGAPARRRCARPRDPRPARAPRPGPPCRGRDPRAPSRSPRRRRGEW